MSDTIKRAKRLFENRYHDEPWLALVDSSQDNFRIETDNFAEVGGDFVSEDDARLAAAAPEMAQALAEETWEYQVQVKRGDQWQFYIGESHLPTVSPGLATGFSEPEHAAEFSKLETKYPTRIVRRRVSQPEVINE